MLAHNTLVDYHIHDDSMIELSKYKVTVTVAATGAIRKLQPKPTDTVLALKRQLQKDTGIDINQQILRQNNNTASNDITQPHEWPEMKNCHILNEYEYNHRIVLFQCAAAKTTTINLLYNDTVHHITMSADATVADLQCEVQYRFHIHISQQQFKIDDVVMKTGDKLECNKLIQLIWINRFASSMSWNMYI